MGAWGRGLVGIEYAGIMRLWFIMKTDSVHECYMDGRDGEGNSLGDVKAKELGTSIYLLVL